MRKHLGYYLKGFSGASELRERVMRTPTAAETLGARRSDDRTARSRTPKGCVVIAEDAKQSLYDETYENYREYVNPPLARVMKLSGSPLEVSAHGTTIVDHNGKAYLDFAGGYGVFTIGHSHPRVVEAVRAQLDAMSLSGKTMFNAQLGRLAKRLAELTPGDLQYSFFCNSGTEAVEGALKLARAATRRSKIVATQDAFHGKTLGATLG